MTLVFLFFWAGMFGSIDSSTRMPRQVEFQSSPDMTSQMMFVGEELEYLVSYSFFDIGTIRVTTDAKEQLGSRTVYRASTYIDSNPSLSWLVDVHIRFYGLIDSAIYSHKWIGHDSTEKQVDIRRMDFDYSLSRMLMTRGVRLPDGSTSTTDQDTIKIDGPSQDGLSLLFYAREHVRQPQDVDVPTYVDAEKGITEIHVRKELEEAEIDAVEYPVETVYLEGLAGFVGVFGLTGGFEGWFSNDQARVPILARMKVILGSIKVQLKSWKRGSWTPPRSKN